MLLVCFATVSGLHFTHRKSLLMSSCSFKDSIIYKSLCVCSEEFAVVAQHSRTSTTLALRLVRHMDATGRPFRLHLARCTRWPQGLEPMLGLPFGTVLRPYVTLETSTGSPGTCSTAGDVQGPSSPSSSSSAGCLACCNGCYACCCAWFGSASSTGRI